MLVVNWVGRGVNKTSISLILKGNLRFKVIKFKFGRGSVFNLNSPISGNLTFISFINIFSLPVPNSIFFLIFHVKNNYWSIINEKLTWKIEWKTIEKERKKIIVNEGLVDDVGEETYFGSS